MFWPARIRVMFEWRGLGKSAGFMPDLKRRRRFYCLFHNTFFNSKKEYCVLENRSIDVFWRGFMLSIRHRKCG